MSLLEPPPPPSRLGLPSLAAIGLLAVWSPLSLAVVAATSWPRLARYGIAAWMLLAVRAAVTAAGLTAARWWIARDPRGPHLAVAVFAASAAVAIVVGLTPYFPSNAVPGTKWPAIGATVALNIALAALSARRAARGV